MAPCALAITLGLLMVDPWRTGRPDWVHLAVASAVGILIVDAAARLLDARLPAGPRGMVAELLRRHLSRRREGPDWLTRSPYALNPRVRRVIRETVVPALRDAEAWREARHLAQTWMTSPAGRIGIAFALASVASPVLWLAVPAPPPDAAAAFAATSAAILAALIIASAKEMRRLHLDVFKNGGRNLSAAWLVGLIYSEMKAVTALASPATYSFWTGIGGWAGLEATLVAALLGTFLLSLAPSTGAQEADDET